MRSKRRLSFLIIFFMISLGVNAQYKPEVSGATLQHVTVVVSDFEVSSNFYKGLLGLKQIPAAWLPENQAFLQLGSNLELHMGEVPGVEIEPSTFNHFAFTVDDLDAFLSYLDENGIWYGSLGGGEKHQVTTRADKVRQTFFQDPDGYWIEVNDFKRK